jgi:hypothetical protein
MPFVKATKTKIKARVTIDGPTGAGKSLSALYLARALVGPAGRIAGIDTERGSLKIYSDKVDFDVLELTPDTVGKDNAQGFSPKNFIDAIAEAEKGKYDAIVIDSLTHAWEGEGGALDLVDQATARSNSKNSYVAWRDVTPMHRKMVDAILQSPCHVITTMRSQMDYLMEKDKDGHTTVTKIGLAPIQRKGMEYEFTLVADMTVDHKLIVGKTRCDIMDGKMVTKPGIEFWQPFVEWLDSGEEAKVVIKPIGKLSLKEVLDWATEKYGVPAEEAREIMKAGGLTSYKTTDAGMVMGLITAAKTPVVA